MFLIISAIVLLIGIGFIYLGKKKNENWYILAIMCIITSIIVGFVILGTGAPAQTKETIQTNCESKKFSDRIIAVCGDHTITSNEIYIYNNIDQFDLILIQKFNSYTSEIRSYLEFRRKPFEPK